ncbi:radical SAM protein [Planctomyces sp. SH-PL62]|uniref:radical SAM protein n=1 Tax=Planctomyces sp. SH-PL62 TaxID=1636152 RepID=UPI00078B70F5|nr:radical SAM protein [Planctomyces sp. SH-PL62]AMV40978.1 hypothetical protein VT85_26320 [Planctomyces sp. SH-PL62]
MDPTFPRIEVHPVDHCNLACIGCNHAAPHKPKTVHDVADYCRWLDLLREAGHAWNALGISGGEPFLHPDIQGFCREIRARHPDCAIEIFTNAFWVRGSDAFDRYEGVLASVDRVMISHYKPIVDRIGWERFVALEDELRRRFGVEVGSFQAGVVGRFAQVEFFEEPRPIAASHPCAVKDCTQLRTSGLLYRCTYGHHLETDLPSAGFRHPDQWFDLASELGSRDLRAWRAKWPLGSCHFCGCGEGRETWTPWVSDPGIRGMDKAAYGDRVKALVEGGE